MIQINWIVQISYNSSTHLVFADYLQQFICLVKYMQSLASLCSQIFLSCSFFDNIAIVK